MYVRSMGTWSLIVRSEIFASIARIQSYSECWNRHQRNDLLKTNFKAYKASAEEKVDENSELPSSNTTSAQQNNLFDELGQLVQSTVSSLINSTFFAIGLSGRYQLCPSWIQYGLSIPEPQITWLEHTKVLPTKSILEIKQNGEKNWISLIQTM